VGHNGSIGSNGVYTLSISGGSVSLAGRSFSNFSVTLSNNGHAPRVDFSGLVQLPSFGGARVSGSIGTNGHLAFAGDLRVPVNGGGVSFIIDLQVAIGFDGRNLTFTGHLSGSFSLIAHDIFGTTYLLSIGLALDVNLGGNDPSGSGSFLARMKIGVLPEIDVNIGWSISSHQLHLNLPFPFSNIDLNW
jgi:hypothetical protein